jgi:hypothetical protein
MNDLGFKGIFVFKPCLVVNVCFVEWDETVSEGVKPLELEMTKSRKIVWFDQKGVWEWEWEEPIWWNVRDLQCWRLRESYMVFLGLIVRCYLKTDTCNDHWLFWENLPVIGGDITEKNWNIFAFLMRWTTLWWASFFLTMNCTFHAPYISSCIP